MSKILVFFILFVVSSFGQKVLVINSNSKVDRYNQMVEEFKKDFEKDVKVLNIDSMNPKDIKNYLYDEYPDIVYTIGAKAYQYANKILPEKDIFFSGIVNYKRMRLSDNRYGVSNELHEGMNITLIGSLFSKSKNISIIYSKYTEDIFINYKNTASKMGIAIVGQKINSTEDIDFDNISKNDALLIISDPILLKDKKAVFKLFEIMKNNKKPIFAYHELFVKYGASLVVSVDSKTIARQVSSQIKAKINKEEFKNIQIPMGTEVILNKKYLEDTKIEYNSYGISVVNRVIQ
jgi:putative ABC transport system substrate-binding protein